MSCSTRIKQAKILPATFAGGGATRPPRGFNAFQSQRDFEKVARASGIEPGKKQLQIAKEFKNL